MPEKYPIPAEEKEIEIKVVNSRFVASIAPAFSEEAARAFIKRIKQRYPDASHHVPAFLIGFGASTTAHCSDDGEPSGTAGRPALAVLQGSGLGDVVVVVTRYFGGTKLGTGGLARAYGAAVKEVLKNLPLAMKVPTATVLFSVPYSLFEQTKLLAERYAGNILEQQFTADVSLKIRFAEENVPGFQRDLLTLTHGKVAPDIIERNPHTIIPCREDLISH